MAISTISNPNEMSISSDSNYRKIGRLVNISVSSWRTNLTIPEGYRPGRLTYSVAEQKTGDNGTVEYVRITFNTDGSIVLKGTNDRFIGSFFWFT